MKSKALGPSDGLHKKILTVVQDRRDRGRSPIKSRFQDWDQNEKIYSAWRVEDKEDAKSRDRWGVAKIVVPVSFATIQTQLTFLLATFTQRDPIFPVPPRTIDDAPAAEAAELVLDSQMDQVMLFVKLYIALRDLLVLGRMVIHTDYVRRVQRFAETVTKMSNANILGVDVEVPFEDEEITEEILFEGNEISVINPRDFYHDVAVSPMNLQEGEYCGHSVLTNLTSFLRLVDAFEDEDNPFINVEEAKKTQPTAELLQERMSDEITKRDATPSAGLNSLQDELSNPMVIDVLNIDLIPSRLEAEGKKLDDNDWPEKWVFWVVNNKIIVRAHPLENDHQMFPYTVAEAFPDSFRIQGPSMLDYLVGLQEHFDHLLNSHWANVRRSIHNQFVADPSRINLVDLLNPDPAGIIRMMPGAFGEDVRTALYQLPITDITSGHVADSEKILGLMQRVSAATDQLMGMTFPGRRSALEISSTQRLAASRMKTMAEVVWAMGLAPLIMMMVSNNAQFMSEDVYVKTLGRKFKFLDAKQKNLLRIGPANVRGRFLFPAFEGTLPTDQPAQVKVMSEMFNMILKVPPLLQIFDFQKLFIEILRRSGMRSPEDFIRMQGPLVDSGGNRIPMELLLSDGRTFNGNGVSGNGSSGFSNRPMDLEKEVRPEGAVQNGI